MVQTNYGNVFLVDSVDILLLFCLNLFLVSLTREILIIAYSNTEVNST